MKPAISELHTAPSSSSASPQPTSPSPQPTPPSLETSLRELFATLLEQSPESIGNHDDLFALGGDSLLVIKLVARIRRTLNVTLTPGDVFDHPNVASLAGFLKTP